MDYGQPFNPFRTFKGLYVPNAVARSPRLSPNAKLAYGRLMQFAGRKGRCWPAVDTLAGELGCAERTARRLLEELEAVGLIHRDLGKGPRSCNMIYFLWHELLDPHVDDLGEPLCDSAMGGECDDNHDSVGAVTDDRVGVAANDRRGRSRLARRAVANDRQRESGKRIKEENQGRESRYRSGWKGSRWEGRPKGKSKERPKGGYPQAPHRDPSLASLDRPRLRGKYQPKAASASRRR